MLGVEAAPHVQVVLRNRQTRRQVVNCWDAGVAVKFRPRTVGEHCFLDELAFALGKKGNVGDKQAVNYGAGCFRSEA